MAETEPLLKQAQITRLYKRRWFVLLVYSLCATLNQIPCYQYTVIANIVVKYYNVSALAVDLTSILFMALYIPMALPSAYIINKWGLRVSALIGSLGTVLGLTIHLFATARDSFWAVLLGQSILSIAQGPLLLLSSQLVAQWFGSNELSTACAFAFLGPMLGSAIGLALPPIIVRNHNKISKIGDDLNNLNWALVSVSIPIVAAICIYFPSRPPTPANPTKSEDNSRSYKQFFGLLKILLYNKGFILHMLAYSINTATVAAVVTLLNQLILSSFPDSEKDVGHIGLIMVFFGVMGLLVLGPFMDYTKKFKATAIWVFLMTFVGVVFFMYSLVWKLKPLLYVSSIIISFFPKAYISVGYQLAIEITYPVPDCTTASILYLMSQILCVFCTLVLAKLFEIWGAFWSLLSHAILLLIGIVLTMLVPDKLGRQCAFKVLENINDKAVINSVSVTDD